MRLPGLFYADDMVLCCESEEDPEGDGGMFCGGVQKEKNESQCK